MSSQTFGTDLKSSSVQLLKSSKYDSYLKMADKEVDQVDPKPILFAPSFNFQKREKQQYYGKNMDIIFENEKGELYIFKKDTGTNSKYNYIKLEEKENEYVSLGIQSEAFTHSEDDKPYTKKESVLFSPYTIKLEAGKTFGDYYKEIATILAANVYYNNFGYMCLEPLDNTMEDISNSNKTIAWNYYQDQKAFLEISIENDFSSFYNDIIVLGKVINGKQAKARIQNQDESSDTNIYRIGIKTKPPYKDDKYYTSSMCLDLAKYYAKSEMVKNKKVTIKSLPLYHLDVNQLITVTILEKNIINEHFLVNNFTIPLGTGTMSISCNNIKNFAKWTEATIYE